MIISMIAAMDNGRAIGDMNGIPWKMPSDMKYFKEMTTGHAVIMGRKTYESIGRPLPNRVNIIITRQLDYKAPKECLVVNSLEAAIIIIKAEETEAFIIGGAEIYSAAIDMVDRVYLTQIDTSITGDIFFPLIPDSFSIIAETEFAQQSPDDEYHSRRIQYSKRAKAVIDESV